MKRNLQRGVKYHARQVAALERLEKQLQSGTKRSKNLRLTDTAQPYVTDFVLTDKDIKRIKLEIQTLKSRV